MQDTFYLSLVLITAVRKNWWMPELGDTNTASVHPSLHERDGDRWNIGASVTVVSGAVDCFRPIAAH